MRPDSCWRFLTTSKKSKNTLKPGGSHGFDVWGFFGFFFSFPSWKEIVEKGSFIPIYFGGWAPEEKVMCENGDGGTEFFTSGREPKKLESFNIPFVLTLWQRES